MTSASTGDILPKSAFLDTNALVDMLDFWAACRDASVELDAVPDWGTLKAALNELNRPIAQLSGKDAESVKRGIRCFRNLTDNREQYIYFTSSVCRSELHHEFLDAIASERLVMQKIPYRVRVRRPQVLYRKALDNSDFTAIQEDIEEFFKSLLMDYELDIVEVESGSAGTTVSFDDVWITAREVWSRILIDVLDCYIYASSVKIESDVFLTSDSNLTDSLDHLYNPTGEWVEVTKSLKEALNISEISLLPRPLNPKTPLP